MSGVRVLAATLVILTTSVWALPAAAQSSKEDRGQAAAVNTELALAYMRDGNLAAARDKIEKALQQNRRTAKTQMAAGFIYDALKDERKARSHYEQAARLGKDDPDVLNNAAVYFCRTGEYRRGEQYLLQAAASPLYKTPAAAYTNAGRCARADGRPKDAELHFRKALAIDPKQPDALLQMAEVSHSAGNGLQARAFLERYAAVAPVTSAMLWLGRRIELGLGDTAQAQRYAQRIRNEFPMSIEAGKLFDEEHQGRP
ncbi:MAG TPA: type IV pilus biogenesis/stability protein PilW [Steroidobacteraceae bacterium]|nr:type IV pilus biogenesis/stability protein PilW [Steroidobacteraceae bacterium]